MKKLTALLLAVIMVLSLTACTQKSEAVQNTESLIKAIGTVTTESNAAITRAEEAYAALTDEEKETVSGYETLVKAREEYGKKILTGRWVSVGYTQNEKFSIMTFGEDGTFTTSADMSGPYSVEGNNVVLGLADSGLSQKYTLENRNGITHLVANNSDYVKEESATYQEVEITTDNWQDYFEIKEILHVRRNGFGEVEDAYQAFQLEPKAEYRNRIVKMNYFNYPQAKFVSVESAFRVSHKFVTVNEDNTYTVLGTIPFWPVDDEIQVVDIDGYSFVYNEYDDGYCGLRDLANYSGHVYGYDERMGMNLISDLSITRIGGTLLLYDNPIH